MCSHHSSTLSPCNFCFQEGTGISPYVLAAIGILSPSAILSVVGAFLRWWLCKRKKAREQANKSLQQPTITRSENLTDPSQLTKDLIEQQFPAPEHVPEDEGVAKETKPNIIPVSQPSAPPFPDSNMDIISGP
jgi:hypothetical protein